MLNNEKGFTVIELIMSFLFSSILALSLFSVIITYRNKQADSNIEAELLAFKSQLIMDVQTDIQLKGLKQINYCYYDDDDDSSTPEVLQPRCVIMDFNDNTSKKFNVTLEPKVDIIKNDDGTTKQFNYTVPYILYGDIRYDIPDASSVYILDDYILKSTGRYDGIESGTTLYKIDFDLRHNDLDTDINISLVASGTESLPDVGGTFKEYSIGDLVTIQLNDTEQKRFRVIQDSNKYKDSITLLYDDEYDNSLIYKSIDFNNLENYSNRYMTSKIKTYVKNIDISWKNADEVRLITTEEISRISRICPQYRGAGATDISLSSSPEWVTKSPSWTDNSSLLIDGYWTMSEKVLASNDNDNGKKVWYVDKAYKTLSNDYVDQRHALRPVIVIKKIYDVAVFNG